MPLLSPFSVALVILWQVSKNHFPFLNAFVMTKQGCNEFKLNSLKLITLSYSTSLPQENSEMSCLQVSEYKDHTVQNANTFLIVCFYKYFMQKYWLTFTVDSTRDDLTVSHS